MRTLLLPAWLRDACDQQLLGPIIKAHQFLVFTVASNLQHAVAYGLDHEQAFYT